MSFYGVNGVVVEPDVSVWLQLISRLSLGAGSSSPCGLACPVLQVPRGSAPSGIFQ